MAKSPDEMIESMIANLRKKTGRSLEEWIKVARGSGAAKHGEIVKFLKQKHELGHGYANFVALRTLAAATGAPASGEGLVAAQYAGAKAALKPIHDALVAAAKKFGADVEVSPKKTCVSLRRARQFALIQPSTNTRIDLGLKLKGVPVAGRLEPWPSPMCTHRVRLESSSQIDRQLLGWLKQSYDAAI
jgi:hypothetical protein